MTDVFCPLSVAVPGGDLAVGVRDAAPGDGPGGPDGPPTVVLVHGVTASHRAWDLVAPQLPGARIVAPDLRGRGRSSEVTGEAGMARHADDLVAVLDHLDVDRAVLVGHSMGAFVSVVAAHRHPERVSRLVLVDGGLPLGVPEGFTSEQVVQFVLGPTAERLSMTFASVDDYLDFWRAHPAFAEEWSPALEGYFAYDLVGEEPALRPATSYAAMAGDTVDLHEGTSVGEALTHLRHPALLLTVPRGLQDQVPGLYERDRVGRLLERLPPIEHVELPDLNHYTVVMGERGAEEVARRVREVLAADPSGAGERAEA